MVKDYFHAAAHNFLHLVSLAQGVELLSPFVYLFRQVYHCGAHIIARAAKRACAHVVGIFLFVSEHAEIDADGAWDEISI